MQTHSVRDWKKAAKVLLERKLEVPLGLSLPSTNLAEF
jgi:hypothetical protein